MENKLPKNWVNAELKEIISYVIGGDWGKAPELISDDEFVEVLCIRGSEIKNWNGNKGNTASLRKIKKSSLENRKLKVGDILVEISGGGPDQPVGRTVLIDENVFEYESEIPKVCTNFLRLLRVYDNLNSVFINHYFHYFYDIGEIVKYQGGSNNLRNLKFKEFETIKIPLPPLAEQNRIVAKLDAIFAQHEAMKTSMAKIPELLKNFRQQVLTQAVTGKLTKEWRKGKELENSNELFDKIYKFKIEWAKQESLKGNKEAKRLISKIKKVKSIKSEDLPNNWGCFSLLDINLLVVDCHNKTAPYEESGIYLIRTTNIKKGEIVLKDVRFVSNETYIFWSKRCFPEPGDILFTREAPMGEAAIIPKDMKICLGQRTMLIRTPSNLIDNNYVLYCLLSNKMSSQINEKAIGTGVKHLRVGDVENLLIPIPSVKEQQEIVNRVESLFAKADAIEQQYKNLKAKIDTLPQAILHKAFKGELSEQLDSDGDAKELLKQIIELKEAQQIKKKPKAKKAVSKKVKLYPENEEVLGKVAEEGESYNKK